MYINCNIEHGLTFYFLLRYLPWLWYMRVLVVVQLGSAKWSIVRTFTVMLGLTYFYGEAWAYFHCDVWADVLCTVRLGCGCTGL